jgi:hypothetical protein
VWERPRGRSVCTALRSPYRARRAAARGRSESVTALTASGCNASEAAAGSPAQGRPEHAHRSGSPSSSGDSIGNSLTWRVATAHLAANLGPRGSTGCRWPLVPVWVRARATGIIGGRQRPRPIPAGRDSRMGQHRWGDDRPAREPSLMASRRPSDRTSSRRSSRRTAQSPRRCG